MLNFKVAVNELPNTNWNDPQVIIMLATLVVTGIFSFLLYKTSRESTKVAKATLEHSKTMLAIENKQKENYSRLQRNEIENDIVKVHIPLFHLQREYTTEWIYDVASIKKPPVEVLAEVFSETELTDLTKIYKAIEDFKDRNLKDSKALLKTAFNGEELANLKKDAGHTYDVINPLYRKIFK